MAKRRKVSDIPKYVLNPEYLASEDYAAEQEHLKDVIAQCGDCVEDYFPQDYDKAIPKDGAWIILLASVHVGKMTPDGTAEAIDVPHLSIWYAMPTVTNFAREIDGLKIPASQAIIQTPQGAVHVWPHEYQIVKDLSKYLEFTEEEGFNIHFLNPEAEGFDERKLHYIRSRGISLSEARRWLLPELKNPYFCYFTFNEEYSKTFGEYYGSTQRLRVRMSQDRRTHENIS